MLLCRSTVAMSVPQIPPNRVLIRTQSGPGNRGGSTSASSRQAVLLQNALVDTRPAAFETAYRGTLSTKRSACTDPYPSP
jgi:hypothetical protein